MTKTKTILLFITLVLIISCKQEQLIVTSLSSPKKSNTIEFYLSQDGTPQYLVKHKNQIVIDSSSMGFDFKNQPSLKNGLQIIDTRSNSVDETWEMQWGEQRKVRNHYNELIIELEEIAAPNRKFNIHFKAYDDGIGFRYEFLPQQGVDSLIVMDENTEFQLTGDHTTWWIPGDWDTYEHLYNTTKVSEINALALKDHNNLAQTAIPENAVNTPVTMRTSDGIYLSFHEANLTDYAGMTLKIDNDTFKLTSELVGSDRLGYKVKRNLSKKMVKTPWRTIQIADKATELIDSKLIVNLNEPNKIGDVSWFEPKKYVGIWWEMHIDKSSWDYGMTLSEDGKWIDNGKAHGRHGATTKNAKRYIDFAAKNGIKGVLVEGWNTGWERWIGFEDREGVFDFITPYPDYDLKALAQYGKEKGVEIIMHHETSGAPRTYEKQLDTAFHMMSQLGIHSVKTGYVGKIIPKGEYHHGQWMVNHYRKVLETGAKYKVAINAHEPIKATGIRRTYPNAIAREGLRGQEFNAWAADGGNPPEHLPIVAFTRMLAGPIDFTPGVFDISLPTKENNQINTTLAQQLALYVVVYSPIQMACDLPENYENQPAFQFIKDVGVNWEQTIVLNGEIGDYVTIAREERNTGNWFVGSITDENKREITINFDFLEEGKTYHGILYKDADDAHYKNNPKAIDIEHIEIEKGMTKKINLVEGGGVAISIMLKQ
ncbi:glycoside hydrolase family 97 protein [Aquimarina megaterium]|uniref:glycoside hydrolase family 97 protein n=1 Tax=Aquimarina megaterium TaxID=1443666 RepID=UPI00046FF068|nr:glycoside hydrolase family 97 protein [Aquimarina megaterium]